MGKREPSKESYTEQFPCMKCGARMTIQSGRTGYRCPKCGQGWVFTWVTPDTPMLRRPALPSDKVD